MSTAGSSNLIWILVVAIFAIGVAGYYRGWWGGGLNQGDVCEDPDGCQCGVLTKCGPHETCDRTGPFGHCRP